MKTKIICLIVSLFLMATLTLFNGCAQQGPEWSYSGKTGPENWAKLSPEYAAAAGCNQSPVNLVTQRMVDAELADIEFNYKAGPIKAINNGHTVQFDYAPGSYIVVDGIKFELKQFHLHSPSEHQIDGRSFPLENHLVHADANGNLAVIGVMFRESTQNDDLAKAWKHMPKEKGGQTNIMNETFDADGLLPKDLEYYRYNGSLTTPPCTEGVRWYVLKGTVDVASEQVEAFREVMNNEDNNRPVQAINARVVIK